MLQWLSLVGLSPVHQSRYPHEFSGGQRQRIGIARALILQPEFVVCDEPISALDVSVQAQVVNLLGELARDLGLTLLFIAHDLSMVRYISDRMAVMYSAWGGGLILGQVFFEPKHPYTETLIASNPEADPEHERQRPSTTIQGEIPSPVNVPAGCRFANRCPQAMAHCSTITPQLKPLSSEPQAAKGSTTDCLSPVRLSVHCISDKKTLNRLQQGLKERYSCENNLQGQLFAISDSS